MNFAQAVKNAPNLKLTENGATAYSTTNYAILDLFGQIGALRSRSEEEICSKFEEAYNADSALTTKMLFYAGNVRGGLGERRTFRICLKWLAKNHPEIVLLNLANIPHYNRWDSLFELVGTDCETEMWDFVAAQFNEDIATVLKSNKTGKYQCISLLAKWLPTETASKTKTRALAKKTITELGLTPRKYRKAVSALRKHLNIAERAMSLGEWDKIEYENLPSYAARRYRQAFARHDKNRYRTYKSNLINGEAKINTSTLFPYDLVHAYIPFSAMYLGDRDEVLEAQWKALPNYIKGENNILVMADVSGSMDGRPIETSIGLAIYFAQRNKGYYHNLYMTFSSSPRFICLNEGESLRDAIDTVRRDGGLNTNLEEAFNKILEHAIECNVAPKEMPEALIVVSDMEIDRYVQQEGVDFVQEMAHRFAENGYEMPRLVMWNVEARNDTFLTRDEQVLMISGQSAAVFKHLCGSLSGKTSWDLMLETLNDSIYDRVVLG